MVIEFSSPLKDLASML